MGRGLYIVLPARPFSLSLSISVSLSLSLHSIIRRDYTLPMIRSKICLTVTLGGGLAMPYALRIASRLAGIL